MPITSGSRFSSTSRVAAMIRWLVVFGLAVLNNAAMARASIVDTVHNLSVTGPGAVRVPAVGQVCVFCHTPHRAAQTRALWNRDLMPTTYNLYASSTLEATLAQPTGASRLCLGCHDGTTALGNLRVPPRIGPVSLGPLTGRASLGTDLSDDHPVSFVFDSALALRQGQLADPLPSPRPSGSTARSRCSARAATTRTRAGTESFSESMTVAPASAPPATGRRTGSGLSHATSPAAWRGTGTNPGPNSPYTTVADNGCENCHWPHSAPRPPSPPERQPGGEGLPRVPRRERGGDEARPGVPETQRAPCHLDQLDPRAPRGIPPSCPAT